MAAVLVSGIYYVGYQYSDNRRSQREYASEEELKQQRIENESLSAGKTDEEVVTNKTTYILEIYDTSNGTLQQQDLPVPAAFLGRTREELIDYLQEYSQEPPEEDIANGFESFELLSYSADKIVLRKSFAPENTGYRYCLLAEDGFVVVYYADMTTLYSYTDIPLSVLPEDVREEIELGKFITELADLYDFLESYSS